MKRKGIGLLIVLVLLVILYFLNRADIELTKQDGFAIHRISEDGYELKSVIHLNNPNLLSSTIKTIREEFRVNGVLVGILDMGLGQGIPGRKETTFPIGLRFTDGDLLRQLSADSTGKGVEVQVSGEIHYGRFIGSGVIKVNQSGTISARP